MTQPPTATIAGGSSAAPHESPMSKGPRDCVALPTPLMINSWILPSLLEVKVQLVIVTWSDLTASSNFLGAPSLVLGTRGLRNGQLDCFMDVTDEGLTLASFSQHCTESEA